LYWGDGSNPSYTYAQYLQDMVTTIRPDVLMYDSYPFRGNNVTFDNFLFSSLLQVRSTALNNGIPYWTWLQSYSEGNALRLPSESDLRMQLFAHLAAGYTGFSYYSYSLYPSQDSALLDANTQPSALYPIAAAANTEARNLGQALRFLTSTDVRFIAGDTSGSPNAAPGGLVDWTAGAGGDSHLLAADILSGNGASQNGLLGFFVTDEGQIAFMLTNLNHGENLSSTDTALTFRLVFDNSINELLTLDRQTGLQQVVPLDNHTLTINLPGGTGNLYKYNTGGFVVPEPAALAGFMLGLAALTRRNRPRGSKP